jgi:hypothetical protein
LQAGQRLRIVVPLLTTQGTRPALSSQQTNGTTISLKANDLVGYATAYYAITGKPDGRVHLKFTSAQISKAGVAAPATQLPIALPFLSPRPAQFIRLIYLRRLSQSDHNMAVVAARRLDTLNTITTQLASNPDACANTPQSTCSWIPAGVAVRPEKIP